MAIIEIKVPGTSDNESAKILKALNLLLRVGEANMQAIADFGAAQKEFHQRMDVAMQQIRDSLSQGGVLPEESQRILNELHSEMETRVGALEELANRQRMSKPKPIHTVTPKGLLGWPLWWIWEWHPNG